LLTYLLTYLLKISYRIVFIFVLQKCFTDHISLFSYGRKYYESKHGLLVELGRFEFLASEYYGRGHDLLVEAWDFLALESGGVIGDLTEIFVG